MAGPGDVEGASPVKAPVKPAVQPKPPSPHIPRLFAVIAIVTLLAVPIVVPITVMKVTGKSGRKWVDLSEAIEAPPVVQAVAPEEVTPEEIKESFLRVTDKTFERFCRPYYTAGFNAYELVEAAMVSRRAETVGDRSGAQIVDDTLRAAAARGINTVRMWGHTTTSLYPFQIAPGRYDERGLKSLDFVLETARKYGLQVIVSFVDNWKYYNGVDQYVDWSTTAPNRTVASPFKDLMGDPTPAIYGTGPAGDELKNYETERHALFFSDPDAKKFYKNHVAFMINRNNSINGRVYGDDPTIIAWNLINEPRCESWLAANRDCNRRFQNWLQEMSTHVRSLDPNHLITIGSEGFYGDSTPELMQYNPQQWARELGQDFVMNTNLPNIDFATVHAWPDNWMLPQDKIPAFLDRWVQSHMAAGAKLSVGSKPVMFEEFGKKLDANQQTESLIQQLRDPIYQSTYASVEKAIDAGQPIAGSMFWKLAIPVFDGQDARGPYGVENDDPTMQIIQDHAEYLKRKMNSQPPRPECGLGAWFGTLDQQTGERNCANVPAAAAAYHNSAANTDAIGTKLAEDLKAGRALVFPTKAACCKAGTGAFAEGCSVPSKKLRRAL
eukprot:GHRR01002041.1.p1 GENE.GHRR01002041.1~~GHRR01002041.1.p1  ORF type:complete len:609 (+),score=135.21 GHRR01002041.1:246-2072(+)